MRTDMDFGRRFVELIRAWTFPLLLLWVVWGIGGGLLQQTPLTHDHPTHLFKAWHFYEKMLPSFRLRGFSHYWVFGFPSGELVPFGEEVWVALFRALTFEKLSWLRTYSLALLGLLALLALSGYSLGKHFFGPVTGFFTGLLVVWDPGAWAESGWAWMMEFGVWPNSLGMAFLMLSMVALDRLASGYSRLRFYGASSLVALALFSHQTAIPFLPAYTSLLLFDRWTRKDLNGRALRSVLGAVIFGFLLSAFYVVPMVARAELTLDLGVRGITVEELAKRIVNERVFHGLWQPLLPLGFAGAFVALKRRIPGSLFLSLGTGLFVLFSTDVVFSEFHVERILPSLRKIEATRMLVGAKVLWFPLVAYAFALPVQALLGFLKDLMTRPREQLQAGNLRWILAWCLALGLLAPYAESAGGILHKAQVRKILPKEHVEYQKDLVALLQHTKKLRQNSSDLYRIAYDLPMHDHLSTMAPVFDDTWIYKVGYTPTQVFWAFPMRYDVELFKKLLVKHIVSTRKLRGPTVRPRGTFGKLKLYDFVPYQGTPFEILGAGKGDLLEFSPERIRIQVKDAAEGSRLKLYVSIIDHFRATVNGKEVSISPSTIHGPEDPFLMEIPVESGLVTFEYKQRASDKIGAVATLLAFPSLFLGRLLRRRSEGRSRIPTFVKRFFERYALRPATFRRLGLLAWVVGPLLALGFANRLVVSKERLLSERSLFYNLPERSLTLDGAACEERGRFVWRCADKGTVKAERVSGQYGTHLCLTAPRGQRLILKRRVTLTTAITGRYDVRPGSGTISVAVDQESLGRVAARAQDQGFQFLRFDTRGRAGQAAEVEVTLNGSPLHCFDFATEF